MKFSIKDFIKHSIEHKSMRKTDGKTSHFDNIFTEFLLDC